MGHFLVGEPVSCFGGSPTPGKARLVAPESLDAYEGVNESFFAIKVCPIMMPDEVEC